MQSTLVVQIGTYSSLTNVMSLCLFPGTFFLPEHFKIVLNRWIKGKMHPSSFDTIDKRNKFVENYQTDKFNDIDIKYSFEPYGFADGSIKILEINGYVRLSPLNDLWGEVYGYILKSRKQEAQRSECESREIKTRFYNLTRYPTISVYVIKFESSLDKLNILSIMSNVIINDIKRLIDKVDIFACADIVDNLDIFGFDILDKLAQYPIALEKLDTQFDDYHDVLIANKDLCLKIENALYWMLAISDNHMMVAPKCDVVSVYPEYFVPKDFSTEGQKPGPDEGEYMVGTFGIISRRRLKYLIEHKLLHTSMTYVRENPLETWVFFPAIQDKYAALVQLKPDNMLMLYNQKYFADKISEEVEKNFDQLSEIVEIRKKVWMAHERAYSSVGCIPKEIIAFIKERLFLGKT